ncbi:MAG: IS91 family transposase [Polaribacter sp.]
MARQKNRFELSDVVQQFGKQFIKKHSLSSQQTKVLHNIVRCRTATLGGHKEVCNCCNKEQYSYNSCGDRHCPKCQHLKQINWIEKLQAQALPVKHYHIIFTVPHCLNNICQWNAKLYHQILFKSVWKTLRSFGYTHYGVESGAIAVLHTWGQNLSLHPHIHCIVPAGGVDLKGNWKAVGKNDKYLYPVQQLSASFKATFLACLKKELKQLKSLSGFYAAIQMAYNKKWVVYCEAPMTGVSQVIKYLGQYTHKIAISNRRIQNITKEEVHFYAKDYRDNATVKLAKLKGVEFLRRFVQHVLPKGFVRIRKYGVYNASLRKSLRLQLKEKQTDFEALLTQEIQAENGNTGDKKALEKSCPFCKKGTMIVVKKIARSRSPPAHLPTILLSYLN